MCNVNLNFQLDNPRELTYEEREILDKMMSVEVEGKEIIEKQLESAKVTGYCTCGCKSINIKVSHNAPKYPYPQRVPVEMLVDSSDGVPIQILLHIVNGYVSELEILRVDSQPIDEKYKLETAIITVNSVKL